MRIWIYGVSPTLREQDSLDADVAHTLDLLSGFAEHIGMTMPPKNLVKYPWRGLNITFANASGVAVVQAFIRWRHCNRFLFIASSQTFTRPVLMLNANNLRAVLLVEKKYRTSLLPGHFALDLQCLSLVVALSAFIACKAKQPSMAEKVIVGEIKEEIILLEVRIGKNPTPDT